MNGDLTHPSSFPLHPFSDRVRKPAKRPGREPGACGFDSHFGHCESEVGSREPESSPSDSRLSTPDSSRKAAEYGWPGRIANAVLLHRR